MYRLLIADDEALEREGLEWIIRRHMPETFEVIHAGNGREAIQLAEEHRPHVLLMDVNMPGIQGLAALREIRSFLPDAKSVLVTAYDYFAYAKEALTLGVKEYIVKPARREQVVRTLQQLVEELDREKLKRAEELKLRDRVSRLQPLVENELALMFMVDQVLDANVEQLADWLDFPLDWGTALVVAFPEQVYSLDKKKIYDAVRGFAKHHAAFSCIVSSLIDRHMAIFAHRDPDDREPGWSRLLGQYGQKLCELAERQLGCTVSVGIGTSRHGADGLRTSYFEAVFASTYEDYGHVCHFEQLKQPGSPSAPAEDQTPHGGGHGENIASRSYVISALQRIREEREQQTLSVLDRAQGYIRERFTEDLSLEEVADFVHLNPHYFSKVFKQQVGETFIDFLTGLRIEKAKELILSEELSLKEVCFAAGYKDPNYFSRVFKKVTGLTPTEYRAQAKA